MEKRRFASRILEGKRRVYKIFNKYGFELYKEYNKPYKRYIEDKNWDDKKNRNISFLIFRKY